MNDELFALSACLGRLLVAQHKQIAVAESCTGGMVAQTLTEIAGSSAWFDRGFVTYSNAAKIQMLGVQPQTLEQFGAVSAETALAMVAGVLSRSDADYGLAVTGIAGPGGGSAIKPVGTVFIAWAVKNGIKYCEQANFSGDRREIRRQTTRRALSYWVEVLSVNASCVNV
ncbi:MAG: CinA family protein [Methylococcaceae bacterium]|nr:CinA family protein [Methylococcaceae bacterium]